MQVLSTDGAAALDGVDWSRASSVNVCNYYVCGLPYKSVELPAKRTENLRLQCWFNSEHYLKNSIYGQAVRATCDGHRFVFFQYGSITL